MRPILLALALLTAACGFTLPANAQASHDGEILGAWLFLTGLSSSLLTFLRGDGVVATQFIGAAMVLAGGLLWLRRQPAVQVSHGG